MIRMADQPTPKRQRTLQSDVPRESIGNALAVARALHEQYAGDPTSPLSVAQAADLSPRSSRWRDLTGASIAYGLTKGGSNAPHIELTDLGRHDAAPQTETDDLNAMREAALKPTAVGMFLRKYDGKAFPRDDIAKTCLSRIAAFPATRSTALLASLGTLPRRQGS